MTFAPLGDKTLTLGCNAAVISRLTRDTRRVGLAFPIGEDGATNTTVNGPIDVPSKVRNGTAR